MVPLAVARAEDRRKLCVAAGPQGYRPSRVASNEIGRGLRAVAQGGVEQQRQLGVGLQRDLDRGLVGSEDRPQTIRRVAT